MIPPRNAVARRVSVLMAGLRCVAGIMGVLLGTLVYSCGGSAPTSPTPVTGTRDTRTGTTAGVPAAAAAVSDSQSAVGIEAIVLPPDGSTLKATAPTVQSPNNGEVVDDLLRPTLTVLNARGRFVSTALQHRFEVWKVADDGTIILAAVGMAEQTPNTTSHTVGVPLNQDTSYQWRSRAERNEFFGPWSGWGTFRTPVPVTIAAPLLWQPTNGTTVSSVRPVLEVANGEVSANAGAVTYEFQIATDFSFENVVATLAGELGAHTALPNTGVGVIGTHAQTQYTSVQPDFDLEYETTYYWRVRGTNEIVVTMQSQRAVGAYTAVWAFTTPSEAESESGSGVDAFDLSGANFLHANISGWPVTSTITSVTIGDPPICINHTKSGAWPSVSTAGTIVEGNPWIVFKLGGQWYAGTYEWNRPGQTCKHISASNIGDHIKVSPGNTYRPVSGETVYFFVSTPARFGQEGPLAERSNVVKAIWP